MIIGIGRLEFRIGDWLIKVVFNPETFSGRIPDLNNYKMNIMAISFINPGLEIGIRIHFIWWGGWFLTEHIIKYSLNWD